MMYRHQKRFAQPRLRIVIVLALVTVMSAATVFRAPALTAAARLLTVDTVPESADFIVALGGGAETRPFAAADLYRRGVAPVVLVFQHQETPAMKAKLVLSETEIYRRVLHLEGVPPEAVRLVPGIVASTWDEAVAVRRTIAARRFTRLAVVTSPEHTRRAAWTFREALQGLPVDVRMAPAPHVRFDETTWWRHDEGVLLYLHEYLKLPYYWATYAF